MDRKDQLEEIHLYLDNAVSQIERCLRSGRGDEPVVANFDDRSTALLGDLVALRNEVRDALMKELATRPKKLPTL